jgi:hypothetical protein
MEVLDLQGWNYFFIIGGLIAMLSLRLLAKVKEQGEIHKHKVAIHMRAAFRNKLRKNIGREMADNLYSPSLAVRRKVVRLFKTATTDTLKESA